MTEKFKRLFSVLLFLLISVVMFGQGATTSGINGRIVDSKGQPLPGATIIAVHVPSGTQYGALTNPEGFYTIQGMRPGGPYKIDVSFVGYSKKTFADVSLSLGEAMVINTPLTESSTELNEVVVVAAVDRTFNSGRTGAANNVTSTQISATPTISRSITDMTRLTPQSSGYSFAGRNSLYNNLSIDGSVFNNSFGLASTPGGQTNAQPISLDAIEAIQVSLAPYDVRQSGFTGAGINAITRSGTNEFTGSIYQFWRNQNFISKKVGDLDVTNDNFSQKQQGFRIGGPIIKNKLFFFVNAEIERRSDPAHNYLANRGTAGANVSRALATDLDALKDFLIAKYNYDPGVYENYKYLTSNNKLLVRLDYNINNNNKFSVRYNYLKSFRDNPPSTSNASGGRANGLNYLGFSSNGYRIYNNINSVIGELNSKLSDFASNNFIVGWTGFRDFRESPSPVPFPMVDILSGGSTYTSFGYEQFSVNNTLNTDVFQVSDNFTLYKGRHTLTAGGSLEYFKFENGYMRQLYSYYRYNSLQDFYDDANGVLPAGRSIANYQLQYSAVAGDPAPLARLQASQVGIYVQDEWKALDRLKLTVGLRVDMPFYPSNLVKNPALDGMSFVNGSDGSSENLDVSQLPKTMPLLSPRLGFNYDVFGNRSTQVRGGLGIFTGRIPFVWISNQASNNGLLWGRVEATNTRLYPFSSDVTAYIPANPTIPATFEINATADNFKFPQVFRSNIAVDQKLPFGIIGTLEGIFTKDINAVYHRNDNLPVPTLTLPDGRALFPANVGAVVGTRVNQAITGAYVLDNTNKGNSFFITAQLEKTFDFGLYTMAAYTYGQTKDVTSNPGSVASSAFNYNYVKSNPNIPTLAFSDYDQPHKVVGNISYKIDYLDHASSSFALIYLGYQSGRYSYTYSGDLNRDGVSGNDLVYVPVDASDIILIPVATSGTIVDPRSAAEIWDQLDAYITQDAYLNSHRGQIVDRNHSLLPFVNQVDVRFTQDLYLNVAGKKNTLEFTLDVLNIGNLLNSDWGVRKQVVKYNFLQFRDYSGAGGAPRFSFPYFDAANQVPLTSTYINNVGLTSRWQIQLGLRYIFN